MGRKLKFSLSKKSKLVIKWGFVVLLLLFLWNKFSKEDIAFNFIYLKQIVGSPILMVSMVALTLLNWVFDTIAWKAVSKDHQEVPMRKALATNLISQYIGVLTPFGLGEYRAKMRVFTDKKERNQSVVNTVSYRWSKSVSKFGVGLIAGTYLLISQEKWNYLWALLLAWAIYFIFVVKYKSILNFAVKQFKLDVKWGLSIDRINVYPSVLPSALKFLSYALQFGIIVFSLFNVPFWDGLMYGIILYSITSFIPQASFLDPLIKGGIATYLLPNLIPAEAMLSTVLAIWIFNIGAPAVLGAVLWLNPTKPKA